MRYLSAVLILFFGFSIPAGCETRAVSARTFRVLRVVDGDTFKVRYDGDVVGVRLWGIDAPERGDPGGSAATAALKKLIDAREVRLVFCGRHKRDNFGRSSGRVSGRGSIAGIRTSSGITSQRGSEKTTGSMRRGYY